MKAYLVFFVLLAATFASSVKTKPHRQHHGMQKTSSKDLITAQVNTPQVSPTSVTYEASHQEQEDEQETSSENNSNTEEDEKDGGEKAENSRAMLLSDKELLDMLKKETQEMEQGDLRPEASTVDKEGAQLDENSREEGEEKEAAETEESAGLFEEIESSTESEVPTNMDYAADSGIIQPVQTESDARLKDVKQVGVMQKTLSDTSDELNQNMEDDLFAGSTEKSVSELNADSPDPKRSTGSASSLDLSDREEDKLKNDSETYTKRKTRKHKKKQRTRKHSPKWSGTLREGQEDPQDPQEPERSSTSDKPKRRRPGKWGPLVGVNPVQIRATADLYPTMRPSFGMHLSDSSADPCDNFRCKRGKTCKLGSDGKPACVCQEPSQCPPSMNDFDHVCGTDNKTYDTSCELFATKCKLDGTKRGHRLHLDYTGPCKLIPPCDDSELIQFPLRMRDWLKNVLLQLYEHDSVSAGFLTTKQRFRVRKIFENERRLHAGNHSVELLAQDFEKNYNMYIYPVHWQFAQLDQHPSDRFLSHSELAPLRVPLVPMEHCTSLFFQECDADKDKQVSFREWVSCFAIKDDDMDVNLLF